jgi:hypothetical protein
VGLCPICIEAPERGGEGKKLWLSMKFSAFKWLVDSRLQLVVILIYELQCSYYFRLLYTDLCFSYHMQYGHGMFVEGLPVTY